jgi:hypothetical protein
MRPRKRGKSSGPGGKRSGTVSAGFQGQVRGFTRQWSRPPPASAACPLPAAADAQRCYDFRCQELGATLSDHHDVFCSGCIGRGGASQRRRLILLISVGWRPPDWRPSGAGLHLGASVPAGLATPSRVTPYRGRVPSDGRLCFAAQGRVGHFRVARGPLGPWPTERRSVPWQWPPGLDWRVSPVHSACGSVCRAVLAPSS